MNRSIWKNFIAGVLIAAVFTTFSTAVYAETRTAEEYMAEGIRAAYDNMHLIYQAYYDDDGNLETQPAGHVAVFQEWDGDQLVSRTYLDENCQPVNRVDGYAKALFERNEYGARKLIGLYNTDEEEIDIIGLNLVRDIDVGEDGWSRWYTPQFLTENYIMKVGSFNYCDDKLGDTYTLQIEIEFKNVKSQSGKQFTFRTAGMADNTWDRWGQTNLWNFDFIWLDDVPEDGIYIFSKTISVRQEMLETSTCNIGFRFDYWKSGSFRIRNVKIEKGSTATEWTLGL